MTQVNHLIFGLGSFCFKNSRNFPGRKRVDPPIQCTIKSPSPPHFLTQDPSMSSKSAPTHHRLDRLTGHFRVPPFVATLKYFHEYEGWHSWTRQKGWVQCSWHPHGKAHRICAQCGRKNHPDEHGITTIFPYGVRYVVASDGVFTEPAHFCSEFCMHLYKECDMPERRIRGTKGEVGVVSTL